MTFPFSHSVHLPFLLGRGVEPPTKSKKRGLTGPQLLEGCDFFSEGGGGGAWEEREGGVIEGG